jgi:hypothetical protein
MRLMNATDVLKAMLALFRDGEGWCQGYCTRSAEGEPLGADSPRASRYCLLGARNAVMGANHVGEGVMRQSDERLRRAIGQQNMAGWNDAQLNYGSVRAALLAAIADGK